MQCSDGSEQIYRHLASKTVEDKAFQMLLSQAGFGPAANSPWAAKALQVCSPARQHTQVCSAPAFALCPCHALHRESHRRAETAPKIPELKTQFPAMPSMSVPQLMQVTLWWWSWSQHWDALCLSWICFKVAKKGTRRKKYGAKIISEVWKDFCVGNKQHRENMDVTVCVCMPTHGLLHV